VSVNGGPPFRQGSSKKKGAIIRWPPSHFRVPEDKIRYFSYCIIVWIVYYKLNGLDILLVEISNPL